jgi:hypothetical protein
MTTKTLYKQVGSGPLKRLVPYVINVEDAIANVKSHFNTNGNVFIKKILDEEAKLKGYDSIDTACGFAGAVNTYQKESQAFVIWRAEVWTAFITFVGSINATNYETINITQFVSSLPKYADILATL